MLINLRTMLKAASAKKMAVGAFNVYNVESLQAVLAATKASNHAVILSFGEKYDQHMPIEAMAELVKFYGHTSSQPIVLHLDHCKQESNVIPDDDGYGWQDRRRGGGSGHDSRW